MNMVQTIMPNTSDAVPLIGGWVLWTLLPLQSVSPLSHQDYDIVTVMVMIMFTLHTQLSMHPYKS